MLVGSRELRHKFVLGDDWDSQLVGLLIFGTGRHCIVVDELVRCFAHASRHLSALTFDVGLERIAILIMNDITRDDEGEPGATIALLRHRWL